MNRWLVFVLGGILIGYQLVFSAANPQSNYQISGRAYFNYSYNLTTDGPRTEGNFNSFAFTRFYMTIDRQMTDDFAVRFRTDVDRKADDKLRPFVKAAYLRWENLWPHTTAYIGIVGTPTWSISEHWWGYRGLAKTVWDNFKRVTGVSNSSSSADVGFGFKGVFLNGRLSYRAVIANGTHYSAPENDQYKKVYLSAAYDLGSLLVEGYVDYEPKGAGAKNFTYKTFVGYKLAGLIMGLDYYSFTQGSSVVGINGTHMNAVSGFIRYGLTSATTVVLRYDRYDPDTDTGDTETSLVIGALDYRPIPAVHVMPNVYVYLNGNNQNNASRNDVIGNLTFQWDFK